MASIVICTGMGRSQGHPHCTDHGQAHRPSARAAQCEDQEDAFREHSLPAPR